MTAIGLDRHVPASALPGSAGDLPRWRDRLERLWVRQVRHITELSLAFHDAAAAGDGAGNRKLANAQTRRLQGIMARTASARRALAEIEAALARVDTATFGKCELCGGRLDAARLEATPQARYCRDCNR